MLVAATVEAGIAGRLVNDDNYRAVFVYAFIGIMVQQRDVSAIFWTAAGGALAVTIMIVTTWGRHGRQLAAAT